MKVDYHRMQMEYAVDPKDAAKKGMCGLHSHDDAMVKQSSKSCFFN